MDSSSNNLRRNQTRDVLKEVYENVLHHSLEFFLLGNIAEFGLEEEKTKETKQRKKNPTSADLNRLVKQLQGNHSAENANIKE